MLNKVNSALVLVAALFLTMGILWWSGIIEPSKSSIIETPADTKPMELGGKRGPEKGASKQDVGTPKMKTVISDDARQPQVKTPIGQSKALKEQVAVVETPVTKEDTLSPFVPTEQEKAFFKPERDIHVEQSKLKVIARVSESKRDVKQTVGPETTMSSDGISSFPYSIVVAHCRDVRNAEEVISQYEKEDLVPNWVKVEVSNGVWYRVFVGSFKDRMEAETFKQRHGLKESRIMKTVYANLIGVYASSEELQNRLGALTELGYSPYVTSDQNGGSRLLIGAFITKEGAESQYEDLKSRGIESRIIKR